MIKLSIFCSLAVSSTAFGAEINAKKTSANLDAVEIDATIWASTPTEVVPLTAQPMYPPRPSTTTTDKIKVQAVYNAEKLSMRLSWADTELSEAGKLGEQSDAVAVQFPVRSGDAPPLVFMGTKGDPVHIFHWRAQYQRDAERGKPTVKDLYPNMTVDMYPMEFKDHGNIAKIADSEREKYSPAVAVGNPQSYPKNGVDEILAEGFGTSSVKKPSRVLSTSVSRWKNGEWTVVLTRPLVSENTSSLNTKTGSFAAFAVWQGGKGEVGSRKTVTMMWTPITFKE